MLNSVKPGALALSGLLAAFAFGLYGCGGPEGAGTVSISAAKEAAAKRGIPEGREGDDPAAKIKKASRRNLPTTALPKGGR